MATSILQSPEGLELGGEEREVTLLMSDLRGFTALAARLTPREVIEFLNLYLEAMVDVISRYEGTIDEIIGDAILVIFGAPVACEDHAAKAVACGLAMQLAMAQVNERLKAKGAAELEMGIGVHTGRVIVGNIGSVRRTKYAAVGSNVNLAGRIESFTTGGQLLISESTRAAITSPLRLDAQFSVEPKGAKGRLQLHEVGGIGEPFDLALPARTAALEPLPSPLPISFTVLEEKFLGRTVHSGQDRRGLRDRGRHRVGAVPRSAEQPQARGSGGGGRESGRGDLRQGDRRGRWRHGADPRPVHLGLARAESLAAQGGSAGLRVADERLTPRAPLPLDFEVEGGECDRAAHHR